MGICTFKTLINRSPISQIMCLKNKIKRGILTPNLSRANAFSSIYSTKSPERSTIKRIKLPEASSMACNLNSPGKYSVHSNIRKHSIRIRSPFTSVKNTSVIIPHL
jgi:hypothetical protein